MSDFVMPDLSYEQRVIMVPDWLIAISSKFIVDSLWFIACVCLK